LLRVLLNISKLETNSEYRRLHQTSKRDEKKENHDILFICQNTYCSASNILKMKKDEKIYDSGGPFFAG